MYAFQSAVRYSETDETGTLTVPARLNYLQDSALFQSEELGHGVDHARTTGLRWLLAAWRIEIGRLPRFTERIEVATWATGFDGLYARRNFTLDACDRPGEHLVRADSVWFMLDAQRGRPVRLPQAETDVYAADLAGDTPLAMQAARRRIPVEGPGEPADPVTVTRAHIDTNHHVNNAQYVAMACAALPERLPVRLLEVQYASAAHLGDTVYPHVRRPRADDPDEAANDPDAAWTGHPRRPGRQVVRRGARGIGEKNAQRLDRQTRSAAVRRANAENAPDVRFPNINAEIGTRRTTCGREDRRSDNQF